MRMKFISWCNGISLKYYYLSNKVIENGDADLVAFGKLYISNPDLVGRFKENIPTAEWDANTFYSQGPEGYIDYEAKTRDLIPTS